MIILPESLKIAVTPARIDLVTQFELPRIFSVGDIEDFEYKFPGFCVVETSTGEFLVTASVGFIIDWTARFGRDGWNYAERYEFPQGTYLLDSERIPPELTKIVTLTRIATTDPKN
ncbi:hypothetical protein KA001_01240 [Patescibacteria group bacterium]|nr:hypothetical protein [Patescibacteria group bacterium]